MITTLEQIDILDQSDKVANIIQSSNEMKTYIEKERALKANEEAQKLIAEFNRMKDQYDEAQRFGTYHPDYNKIMKTVRSAKRRMDMNEYVAAFKIAERSLQNLLDEVSEIIASSVSETIMVPKEGILAASGCASGGCGTGGSCAC